MHAPQRLLTILFFVPHSTNAHTRNSRLRLHPPSRRLCKMAFNASPAFLALLIVVSCVATTVWAQQCNSHPQFARLPSPAHTVRSDFTFTPISRHKTLLLTGRKVSFFDSSTSTWEYCPDQLIGLDVHTATALRRNTWLGYPDSDADPTILVLERGGGCRVLTVELLFLDCVWLPCVFVLLNAPDLSGTWDVQALSTTTFVLAQGSDSPSDTTRLLHYSLLLTTLTITRTRNTAMAFDYEDPKLFCFGRTSSTDTNTDCILSHNEASSADGIEYIVNSPFSTSSVTVCFLSFSFFFLLVSCLTHPLISFCISHFALLQCKHAETTNRVFQTEISTSSPQPLTAPIPLHTLVFHLFSSLLLLLLLLFLTRDKMTI